MDRIIEILSQSERLEELKKWMYDDVWSKKNFLDLKPNKYLETGEAEINKIEELILYSAPDLYNEICEKALHSEPLISEFDGDEKVAVIIYDGLSVRELPLLEKLSNETGFEILESKYDYSTVPSETLSFVEQRLIPGKKISPSALQSRSELKEKNIKYYYYDAPVRSYNLSPETNLLLWSHFPDGTYQDLNSRFSDHFEQMIKLFEVTWKNIVLNVPSDHKIIITSDHGYVFFGQGLDTVYNTNADYILDRARYRFFKDNETLPDQINELQIIGSRRLAMLRGRIKNRIQGPMGNKAYRHGGISLMEMLVPKLVIKKSK